MPRLECLLDTILPADDGRGMPPGSAFAGAPCWHDLGNQLDDYLDQLDALAQAHSKQPFAALSGPDRLRCVQLSQRKQARLATPVLLAALKAYYSAPGVLRQLDAGAVPPFPAGNAMPEDDWLLLEPVFARGRMYREVSP